MKVQQLCATTRHKGFDEWAARNRVFGHDVPLELFKACWIAAQDVEIDACIQLCKTEWEAAPWDDGNAARAAVSQMLARKRSRQSTTGVLHGRKAN